MSSEQRNDIRVEVGDVVPDLPLLDHTGEVWRFSEHRGTPILAILHRHLA